MKVYVVMGNDFPDAVFSDAAAAERYIAGKNQETKTIPSRRVYWRAYAFLLDAVK